ncbi:hypothetical protein PM082_007633 [Marasmius tenuissimus]|nr:hypothetical protein PM082_007633 [Marasmius tenuissimus]
MTSATGFTKTTLKIPSGTYGWDLDVWCFLPSGVDKPADNVVTDGRWPVVVMAHGWCCNKLMSLSPYAETFVNSGYACLVFDYHRWGASDGIPRHILSIKEQLEDYRTVIRYAQLQLEFDPDRVVVWGTSFSGESSMLFSPPEALKIRYSQVATRSPSLARLLYAFVQ